MDDLTKQIMLATLRLLEREARETETAQGRAEAARQKNAPGAKLFEDEKV